MIEEREDEGSKSIPEQSGQTLAAAHIERTVETVEKAVETVCATRWCYSRARVN